MKNQKRSVKAAAEEFLKALKFLHESIHFPFDSDKAQNQNVFMTLLRDTMEGYILDEKYQVNNKGRTQILAIKTTLLYAYLSEKGKKLFIKTIEEWEEDVKAIIQGNDES